MGYRRSSVGVRTGVAALALAVVVAACGGGSSGGGSNNGSGTTASVSGGTANVVITNQSDSLDPAIGTLSDMWDSFQNVYTPLLTYKPVNGTAGLDIVPGLATAMPKITDGGRTYTLYLRKGLKFSNGQPVVASDFKFALDRSLRLNSPQIYMIEPAIVGSQQVLSGKAKTVSGVTTDNATGKIVIHLKYPYGQVEEGLAYAFAAPIAPDTPIKNLANDPPAGVGAYKFADVQPNASYAMVKNPYFKGLPDEQVGSLNRINFNVETDSSSAAEQVISNQADLFDPWGTLPAAMVSQATALGPSRYTKVVTAGTNFFAFNVTHPPFNNQLVREAAAMALDKGAMARLANGFLTPSCSMLPQGMAGAPTSSDPCPYYGSLSGSGNIAGAKKLIQKAGAEGEQVQIWSISSPPYSSWADYYASVLNKIGLKANEHLLGEGNYWQTIITPKVSFPTEYGSNSPSSRDPLDMFELVNAVNIQSGVDPGHVDDPAIQRQLSALNKYPVTEDSPAYLQKVRTLNSYIDRKVYMLMFGLSDFPLLTSDRIDHASIVFNQEFGVEYNMLKLR